MKNKIALITGATSGIGKVIAKHLASNDYSLIVLGRSKEKLERLEDDLMEANPNARITSLLCNLSSLKSVKTSIEGVKALNPTIDLMILNAGLWNFEFIETEDGIEETLQVNIISSLLLLEELKELIPNDSKSKVIFTASGLHQGEIYFDDLEFRKKFSGFKAYRQSKLGLILLTRWLAKQGDYKNISVYSVHPGMVNTELGRSAGWLSRSIFKLFGKSPEKGAQTHIHIIDTEAHDLVSGGYYANSTVKNATAYSHNMDVAEKLYSRTKQYY